MVTVLPHAARRAATRTAVLYRPRRRRLDDQPRPTRQAGRLLDKAGLSLTGLLDPKLEAATAYGILNEAAGRVRHPTAVVIDRDGIVRYARTDVVYTKRPSVEELLKAVKELPAAAE